MTPPSFQLQAGPYAADQLFVTGFEGVEALSQPFELRIDFFHRDGEPLELAGLLGAKALLSIALPQGDARHVHGFIQAAEALGEQGGRLRYQIRLVPSVEQLTRIRRSRIFQNKSAQEIVKAVLDDAGVEHRWALDGSCAPREYCVQYRETDLDFISRLLEWEGIHYYFEHSDSNHVMVLGDGPSAAMPLPGGELLPFLRHTGRVPDEEHLFNLERVHRLRSGAVMVKDFNYLRPSLDVSAKGQAGSARELEVYEYPSELADTSSARRTSKARLEERRQGERTLDGESVAPRLSPGFTFEVEAHPDASFNGKHLVVEVRHHGHRPEVLGQPESLHQVYRNELRCLPSSVPYRPPHRTQRPVVPGLQTATVVGPAGEEIHTDEHGRIKVQFHWDRLGKNDDASSCWVRAGQTWGGPAWGALFLPRIGQEVVIRFLEGNPDRPVISGAVYNGANPPPYTLPSDKTMSTVQSNSTPNATGANEFRIEDSAGSEEVYLHAQKDEEINVENDKSQDVHGFEELEVKKDRSRTVEKNQRLDVTKDDRSLVVGNQQLQVLGNRTTEIRRDHDEAVTRSQSITVAGALDVAVKLAVSEAIGAAKALSIGGASFTHVALAHNVAVGGLKAEQVAGARTEFVLLNRQETVEKDRTSNIGGEDQNQVDGKLTLAVGKDLTEEINGKSQLGVKEPVDGLAKTMQLKATDKLSIIVNGKLALTMEKSGKVQLFASKLTLEGD